MIDEKRSKKVKYNDEKEVESKKEKNDMSNEASTCAKILHDFNESMRSMANYHADWREYDDFYQAKQWGQKRASWRPDPVINYISYVVDQKRPQITNSVPRGILTPVSPGDEEAVKAFEKVLEVNDDKCDFDSVVEEVVQSGLLLDVGWFYTYWDNTLKGGSEKNGTAWIGDVVVESVDPSNIYVDPLATKIDDARYVIYAVPKTCQWIYNTFNVKVESDNQQNYQTEIYERTTRTVVDDRVMYYAYWYREGEKINVIYMAGNKILRKVEEVNQHNQYPFTPFVSKKLRKSIIGIGESRNIFNNQKLLNKLVEIPVSSTMLTANPIVLLNSRMGLKKEKWLAKPGAIYEVSAMPGESPTNAFSWKEPPSMPTDLYKLHDLLVGHIEKIGGVYDAVTGNTPSGITAASAIQLLQEQGSIPIKGILRNLYASLKRVYAQRIALIKENYTETRYVRINNDDGTQGFMMFNAAQHADVDIDIKITGGASTPLSRAYIAQLADTLFQQGLLLGSEYVELQENLPNKEAIVTRLREKEAMEMGMSNQQQLPQQSQQPVPQQDMVGQQPPSLQELLPKLPPPLQEEIAVMLEQGVSEQEIIQNLINMVQSGGEVTV